MLMDDHCTKEVECRAELPEKAVRVVRKGSGSEMDNSKEAKKEKGKEGGRQGVRKRRVEIKGASDTGWWATKVQPLALLLLDI